MFDLGAVNLGGVLEDPTDNRDYLYLPAKNPMVVVPETKEVIKLSSAGTKPDTISFLSEMTDVGNQGDRGTCVAWSCGNGMKEWQEKKEERRVIKLSVEQLYQWCKEIDGVSSDGTYLRCAMKVLREKGIPQNEFRPYGDSNPGNQDIIERNAETFRVASYATVNFKDVDAIESAIFQNGPLPVALKILDDCGWKSGFVHGVSDKSLGAHAVCLVGYDRPKQLFTFKNSWGKMWGQGGYGTVSYTYFTKNCISAWTSIDMKNSKIVPIQKKTCWDFIKEAFVDV